MENLDRDYAGWFIIKSEVQSRKSIPDFKEGQIWWCAVGENVGVEINGKGAKFERPMIVFRKLSKYGFIGIPLTTQDHTAKAPDWYVHFRFKNKDEYAALHQIESVSVYRLYRKIGALDDMDKEKIETGFANFYKRRPRK